MACSKLSQSNPNFMFPEDLIIDILSRLPVKSLVRFAVVCKNWYTIIKNPDFISEHLRQSKLNPTLNLSSLLVIPYNFDTLEYGMTSHFENALDEPISLDFPFLAETDYISIIGVCDGLVCVSLSEDDLYFVICNFATMNFHEIPECKFWDEDCIEQGEAPLGFGFDPSSNDYKLIKIMRYINEDDEYIEQAEIYSMSTDSWREINIEIPLPVDVKTRILFASATIDGVFYWDGVKGDANEGVILSFDMSNEVYRVIEGPKRYQGSWFHLKWEFVHLKEELALFIQTNKRCYSVWVLNENGTCWNEKFRIGPFPTIERSVQVRYISEINVAGFGKNGDIIVKRRQSMDSRCQVILV